MLVRHAVNGGLYNVVSDEHGMNVLWMATPLVVIDVYEHAFYIDYQNRKAEYVEKFMGHIGWKEVNSRYRLVSHQSTWVKFAKSPASFHPTVASSQHKSFHFTGQPRRKLEDRRREKFQ